MEKPQIPQNEIERYRNLKEYNILDTLPEEDYDNITLIASQICHTPISLVSLIDDSRQWFKSHHGIDASETPKEYAFCAHAINNVGELFIIPDSRVDERFHDNPLVTGEPHVIFYAGAPLISPQGFALGTLCVIDNKPNTLDENQKIALQSLSRQVVNLLELRKNKELLEASKKNLELKNIELERFAHVAAHDLKSPLSSISGLADLIINNYSSNIDDELKELITMISSSSHNLIKLVNGILEHSKSENLLSENKAEIILDDFLHELKILLDSQNEYQFIYPKNEIRITTNKIALAQIFINLVTNGIKYNDKEHVIIEIRFTQDADFYWFEVKDNGTGIKEEYKERIFNIFNVESIADRFGNRGNGIGLATVKKIVEGLGGKITVESKVGIETTFKFSIAK